MPIYMDLHILPGVKARDVAEAHRRDMLIQDDHRCNCMTYWIDEKRGNVFCLIEAPGKNAVEEMHRQAHGLVPHRIIEVNDTLVESFLGRISDPDEAEISEDGLKVFSDPSFRILLMAKMEDPVLLQHQLGKSEANILLAHQLQIMREELTSRGGNEAPYNGDVTIASFTNAGKALSCAQGIRNKLSGLPGKKVPRFRMAIHGGEPINQGDKLFEETIRLGTRMCMIAKDDQIILSSTVKDLVPKDHVQHEGNDILLLSPQDEALLDQLFQTLEENWQNPDFSMNDYRHSMAMSTSQLYRKTISLTGISPNALLKEFRLEKARKLMKKMPYNITQITFDTGFTSPSYFTKCFKRKFDMPPMAYVDMLR